MNRKQIFCLWIGIVVIVLMGIFPPWVHRAAAGLEKSAGYSFILKEPAHYEMGWFPWPDMYRLFIQWVIVAVVTGGLIITFREKKVKDE